LTACDEKCRLDGWAAFNTAARASSAGTCDTFNDVFVADSFNGERCIVSNVNGASNTGTGIADADFTALKTCWTATIKGAGVFDATTGTNKAAIAYLDAAFTCYATFRTASAATNTCVAPVHTIKLEGEDIDTCVAAGTSKATLTACNTAC